MQIKEAFVSKQLFTEDFPTVLLHVLHEVSDTAVEWDRVQTPANNVFERSINAQVAYDACIKLELKMLNIGMEDIRDANRKLMLSVLWQLLKIQ